ncbi:calcium/sodium antiporter [Clostridium sp. MCC353]|nr:calcium/sodium antiporter [Clostridium sp. MCC353]MBT9777177.1 calcium/sodium antiporter [Clostridium sp. MCC353]
MMYVWLLAGFILLVKGADFFVEGSSSVAKLLRVPSIVIGLTIVAFGTSAPELAVSITAAITGNNEIAVGNVIGSNIFNLLVVVGACGVIAPMAIEKKILNGDFLLSIIVTAVLAAMLLIDSRVGRMEGIVLLALFVYFLAKTVRSALANRVSAAEVFETLSPMRSIVYILGGITAIVLGGDFVVDSASEIAASFGLSQTLIGLTIVAMGTSLPELVTSIVASRKGENGLALGNVVGSNLFNILMVLAASAAISPIQVTVLSAFDALFLVISSGIVYFLGKSGYEISRREGTVMLVMYAAYMVYIIVR